MAAFVSELFDADVSGEVAGIDQLTDVAYHQDPTGLICRIAFNRPEVRTAFRPYTVDELYRALDDARQNSRVGVVLLTGNGPSKKDGGWAFFSGRHQGTGGKKVSLSKNDPATESPTAETAVGAGVAGKARNDLPS